MAYIYL